MTDTNAYGLSRHIPADKRLAIRKNCGFGCVICGASIIDYEHVDPEFKDSKEHEPSKMALLCGRCHPYVTRKWWSKDRVKAALASPKCKELGFSWGDFDFGERHPDFRLGGLRLINCPVPLRVIDTDVIRLKEPEQQSAPFRLSATFADSTGKVAFRITDNEWQAYSGAWDMEFTAGRININESYGEQCLILKAEPPNGIAVEKLNMLVERTGTKIQVENEKITLFGYWGGPLTIMNANLNGAPVGLNLSPNGLSLGGNAKRHD